MPDPALPLPRGPGPTVTLAGLGNGAGGGSVLIKSPGSASGGAAAGPDPGAGSGLLLQPASKRARGRSAPSRPVTPRPVPSCPPVPPEMVLGAPVPAPRSHPNGAEPFQQLWVGAFGHRTLILCRIPRPVQRKAGCCRSFGSVSTRRARVSKCHDAKKKKKKHLQSWVEAEHPSSSVPAGWGCRRCHEQEEAPGLLFPSWSRLENTRRCWKRPRAASHHVARAKPGVPRANLSPDRSVKTSERFPPSRQHPGRLQALSPGGSPASLAAWAPRPAEWCRRSPGAGGSRSAGGGC